ncbi:hypothetical protein [Burkholderia catarinensis]|uniref:hypothetical protein n=1 Tax=Burkholderia catarinensis TaxID=1108140 RepID=UPI001FEC3758|nr:hypothetical protein [Burkholderia catarinensis]
MPNPEDDYVLVHDTATTNTTPGSKVYVDINTTPICPNMSNEDFRKTVMRARDEAVHLINSRIAALARWDASEQARVTTYFGRANAQIRNTLSSGLPRLRSAMQELVPEKLFDGTVKPAGIYLAQSYRTAAKTVPPCANPTPRNESSLSTRHFAATRLASCIMKHR